MLSDIRCSPSCACFTLSDVPVCPPDCHQYRGTLDVLSKVKRQVSENIAPSSLLQNFQLTESAF